MKVYAYTIEVNGIQGLSQEKPRDNAHNDLVEIDVPDVLYARWLRVQSELDEMCTEIGRIERTKC